MSYHVTDYYITSSGKLQVQISIAGSGAIALAHLDGSGTAEAAAAMVARVQQLAVGYPEGRIELQLVGGFTDPHRYSDELFANIMRECPVSTMRN